MYSSHTEHLLETGRAPVANVHASPVKNPSSPRDASEQSPRQNHLLAALPDEAYALLAPELEYCSMPRDTVITQSGDRQKWVYFPTSGVISLSYPMRNGASPAITVVGNSGLIGVAQFMGVDRSATQSDVQIAFSGYRLSANALPRVLQASPQLQTLALRYAQTMLTQVTQTAVCNRMHSVEQQLCRWLLMILDNLPTGEIHMTQQAMSNLIGVRRESVTMAAGNLQSDGLIQYNRGCINVLDRQGLEERVCECYEVARHEQNRLLPPNYTSPAGAERRRSGFQQFRPATEPAFQ